jgi:hypothetical protein
MQEYKIKIKKGIDDLKSLSPYYGEWNYFSSYFNITEEEYLKDIEGYENKIREANNSYIQELKDSNQYGVEVENIISLIENPVFDNSEINIKGYPLENYRMIVMDFK